MSKYVKLEEVIETVYQCRRAEANDEWIKRWLEPLNSLPAIEVSEDCDTCRFEDYKPGEEPCIYCFVNASKWKPKTEQSSIEVSEDCISREKVAKRLAELWETEHPEKSYSEWLAIASEWCNFFPSISPSRAEGEWIEDNLGTLICSECKRPRRDSRINHIKFCNSCGARMKG